ncbi:hypothetical protein HUN08_13865 [Gordonia sp. X0973]|uniref:hypothetical protein n=1 Tax=Gordonia sp. X0973 TaxID=2742602 RepID=UPI000F541B00|nr:hypothetical protein [Gordonia sp. X0973]QKT08156.1 hypothetical protein HUN08_13865 [Gordonia sp. X0973]
MASDSDLTAALQLWAQGVAARDVPVPAADELHLIAEHPGTWRDSGASPVAQWWGAAIDHLLGQVELGVLPAIAVAHLPDRLASPAGPPPASGTAGAHRAPTVDDEGSAARAGSADPLAALTAALIAWRGEKIAQGAPGAETIKDITLRNLAKRAPVSAEQIRKKLPGAADLVEELAALFARYAPSSAPSQAPPEPTAAVAPSPPAPAVAPSPTPSAVTRSAPPASSLLPLTHADFCDYEYPETDIAPGALRIATTPDGVRLAWDPFPGGPVVLYRVVSGDDVPPYKPEAGELVGVTAATAAEDNRFLTSAVRHYQVWAHVGDSEAAARAAQPVQWAIGQDISPVEDMVLTEDTGRVVGEWSVFPGTRAVRVFRIPLDAGGPATTDPRFQICVDDANLTGFVDADVPRGRRYLYRALAEVPVGESLRLSRPAQQEILVSVDLASIADLQVAINDNGSLFDLAWTTPESGQEVRVYRFQQPPPAGLEREDLPLEALSVQGFTEETRVRHPAKAGQDPTFSQMTGVPWPSGWDRAYLTPVTVAAGRARIGTTRVLARPLPGVVEPQIVERFHCEMITFGWPRGAAAVRAYIGPASIPSEQLLTGKPFGEVSAEQYERDGALILTRPLTPKGCHVYLVPVSYSAGREITGEAVGLPYRGLIRMAYQFEPVAAGPGRTVVRLVLHAEVAVSDLPPLVAVHRPERLPLDASDGRTLRFGSDMGEERPHCQIYGEIPAGRTVTPWVVDLTNLTGFVRIFVADPARGDARPPIGMLDPPMASLWISPPPPPAAQPGW